ncbi:hypothetical protein GCM10027592_26380 [Spirosoma flavus]
MSKPVTPVESQTIDYPIQTVKSDASLTPALKKGKLLFTANCEACHQISDTRVVGPGLLGVSERVPDRAWLLKWIRNPSTVLNSGDVYANHMVKAFTPVLMPGFPSLTENELHALIDYVDSHKSTAPSFTQ